MWHVPRFIAVKLVSTLLVFGAVIPVYQAERMTGSGQAATFQQFEHGFMIAIGDSVEVYPYGKKDQLNYHLAFAFSKKDIALLADSLTANLPPTHDYQPTGDFGKLWSNSLPIMQDLGWAITPPIAYTADAGVAAGYFRSLPVGEFSVKTNAASLDGGSDSVDFPLLNGGVLRAGQMIWRYVSPFSGNGVPQPCGAQRIQFESGSYAVLLEGTLAKAGCTAVVFLVKAAAQQRMTIFLFDEQGPIIGAVAAPDGTNIQTPRDETLADFILPATGDYSIQLRPDFSEPEPLVKDKYQSQAFQYRYYTLLVVIR